MRVPYKVYPDGLGSHVYAAVVSVRLQHGTIQTKKFEAIIDSGASRCVFDASLAVALGLDLRSGREETVAGISGLEKAYVHEVALDLSGGGAPPLRVMAGFKTGLPVAGLLGMNGFFEHHAILFDPVLRACEINRIHRV